MSESFSKTIVGTTGSGKTNYLLNDILDDIKSSKSSIVFDPHGDLTRDLLISLPSEYADRVDVLAASEDMPFGLNLFECPNNKSSLARDRVVDNVVQLFKRLMRDETGFHPHIETLIRKTSYTLLANPKFTMAEIGYLYRHDDTGDTLRSYMRRNITNPDILSFWDGVEGRSQNQLYQYIEPLLNKVTYFTDSDTLRLIVGQEKTTIPFSDYLDQAGKTLIVYLPIGELGREKTSALGMMLLSLLSEQIYERVRQRQERRIPLKIYIDELGLFATSGGAISDLLTQGRKFGAHVISSFQTFAQLPDKDAESAVLQVPNLVIFSVIGGYDAEVLSKQLKVEDTKTELVPKMRLQPNMKTRWDYAWTDEEERQRWEEITSIQLFDVKERQEQVEEALFRFGLMLIYAFPVPPPSESDIKRIAEIMRRALLFGEEIAEEIAWEKMFNADTRVSQPQDRVISYFETAIRKLGSYRPERFTNKIKEYFDELLGDINGIQEAYKKKLLLRMRSGSLGAKVRNLEKEYTQLEEYAAKIKSEYREYKKFVEQDGWLPVKFEEEHTSKSRRESTSSYSRYGRTLTDSTITGVRDIQIYDMVEGQKRTYADLWNEMQTTLATLDPYNCYLQEINDKKEITETRLETSPPPPKQLDGEERAEYIFERSKNLFGRPDEKVQEMMLKRIVPFLQPQKESKTTVKLGEKKEATKSNFDLGDGKRYD